MRGSSILTTWLIEGMYLGLPAMRSVKCLTPKLLSVLTVSGVR